VTGGEGPTRVAIAGATGRMGLAFAALAGADGTVRLVGGIGREAGAACDIGCPVVATAEEAAALLADAEVVVDFSSPQLLHRLLELHGASLAGRALVVGTTGLGPGEERLLERQAERSAVLRAANFSVGINLLVALCERAAAVLGDGFDAEIVETHHRRKVDAPSGTALALGEAVARGRGIALAGVRVDGRSGEPGPRPPGQIALHAVRGGDVVGEHQVLLIGDRERVVLGHVAQDRALFAEGALRAARWIRGRAPGSYSMAQVLGLRPVSPAAAPGGAS
jgi:4-hydroxy-tetrahydrodipicolinate reductase